MSSAQAITVGLGLGVANTFIQNYNEVIECFESCDSWVLKTEKLLSYVSFIFGFSKPGQLIFKIVKSLLNDISIKFFGVTFDEHPQLERTIELGLSFLGQRKLTDLWDLVRESSLCMLLNNCSNDFFAQLNNLKLDWCNVEVEDDDFYSGRKLSICEQLFNDSPLILLSFLVVALFFIAYYHTSVDGPPPGGYMDPFLNSKYKKEPPQQNPTPTPSSDKNKIETQSSTGTTSPPPKDPKPIPPSPQPEPKAPADPPNPAPKKSSGVNPPPPERTTNPTPAKSSPPNPATTKPSECEDPKNSEVPKPKNNLEKPQAEKPNRCKPTGNTQNINGKCPACNKEETYTLPRPSPMYCCKGCRDKPEDKSKLNSANSNSVTNASTTDDQIKAAVNKHTEDLLDTIGKILCSKCKKHFDRQRKSCKPPPAKQARMTCPDCGQTLPKSEK